VATKAIVWVIFLSALFISSFVNAAAPELTTRQLPNGEYEAVVSYDTDVFCYVPVNSPSSTQVSGFEVLIQSPPYGPPYLCIEPVPPITFYETTALIGMLPSGSYTVSWVQGEEFALSSQLNVPAYSDLKPIPSSSFWSLLLFGLLVLLFAYREQRAG